MNIKKAAELSGIKTDNIRYYERIGLIPKITRTESGIRNFTEANIRTLKFVKHMRDAGVQVEPLRVEFYSNKETYKNLYSYYMSVIGQQI